jgi:hypothetical protein
MTTRLAREEPQSPERSSQGRGLRTPVAGLTSDNATYPA